MRPITPKKFLTIIAAIGAIPALAQPGWSQSMLESTSNTFDGEDYEAQALRYL